MECGTWEIIENWTKVFWTKNFMNQNQFKYEMQLNMKQNGKWNNLKLPKTP